MKRAQRIYRYQVGINRILTFCACASVSYMLLENILHFSTQSNGWIMALFFVSTLAVLAHDLGLGSGRYRKFAKNFVTDYSALIGHLIDSTSFAWGRRAEMLARLNNLLEACSNEQTLTLSESQQKHLFQFSLSQWKESHCQDDKLFMTSIRVLSGIGGEKIYNILSNWVQSVPADQMSDPVMMAKQVLPSMQNRLQARMPSGVLLRPSQIPTSPETLLRPAASSSETEPQQLLRAGQADERNAT